MNHSISDEDLLIHIVHNLPREYDDCIMEWERRIGNSCDLLKKDDLRDELGLKYDMILKRKNIKVRDEFDIDEDGSDEEGQETALVAKAYKGRCYNCGNLGHKKANCPNKKKNGGNRDNNQGGGAAFQGKCYACGKWGHRKADCRSNSKGDKANVGKETDDEDFVLLVFDCGAVKKIIGKREKRFGKTRFKKIKIVEENNESFVAEEENDSEKEEENVAMLRKVQEKGKEGEGQMWLADSGASAHMTNSLEGLIHVVDIKSQVKIGNGVYLHATKIRTKKGMVIDKNRKKQKITLGNVKYVPDLFCNLVSLTQAMNIEFELKGEKNEMKLTKKDKTYCFDQVIPSGKGLLPGIMIHNQVDERQNSKRKKTKFEQIHAQLGHCGKGNTLATAIKFGLKVEDRDEVCESCVVSKQKQKNLGKIAENKAKRKGVRICTDGSSIKNASAGKSKFWYLFVDEWTGYKSSIFVARKGEIAKKGADLLERWKTQAIDIKNVRCDDADENKSLEKELIKRKIKVNYEFTGAGTPQHNGMVERAFATLMGRVRAMLTYAGIADGDKLRGKLWAECASTATHLDNIIVSKSSEKCSYERFHGKKSKMVQHLCTFGEIGIVLKQKGQSMKGKLNDKGKPHIFVGYSDQHSGDVYRMYNPSTGKVANTRDVRFLNMTYGAYKRKKMNDGDFLIDVETPEIKKEKDTGRYDVLKEETETDDENSDESSDSDSEGEKESEPEKGEMTGMRTRSRGAIAEKIKINKEDAHVRNEVERLSVNWHPNTFDDVVEIALIGGTDDDYENPMSFDDAWNHPDEFERMKWREAIRKEIRDTIKRGVRRNVKKNTIPENRRLIGNKMGI